MKLIHQPKLSIIVPVFNEEHLIAKSLPAICGLALEKEIIVIDDGSSDKTPELLLDLQKNFSFTLIRQELNQGKGAAVKRGLQEISGDYFIVCDADLEYEPQDIVRLFNYAIESEDSQKLVAIYGSRFHNNPPISFHYFVNHFLTSLTNLLFSSKLTDMETCFKLIPRSALEHIRLDGKRFEIEPEITARLLKHGYNIKELPISYNRRGYNEGKKITPKDGFLAVTTLLKEKLFR